MLFFISLFFIIVFCPFDLLSLSNLYTFVNVSLSIILLNAGSISNPFIKSTICLYSSYSCLLVSSAIFLYPISGFSSNLVVSSPLAFNAFISLSYSLITSGLYGSICIVVLSNLLNSFKYFSMSSLIFSTLSFPCGNILSFPS